MKPSQRRTIAILLAVVSLCGYMYLEEAVGPPTYAVIERRTTNTMVWQPKNVSYTQPKLLGKVFPMPFKKDTDTNYTATPLLLLFSSWDHSKEKANVHQAAIRLWASWPFVKTAVLTTDRFVQKYATAAGWLVSDKLWTRKDCQGPPLLPPMFTLLMKNYSAHYYGFSNSDIMFGDGLVETLKFLHEHDMWRDRPLLVVGRRHNVDFKNSRSALNVPADVARLTANGTLVIRSTDYYITNKHFPWNAIPKVTIGRPFVVRTVIGFALQKEIDIIDATNTVEAVHLTTQDGIYASFNKEGKWCNSKVLGRLKWRLPLDRGHCECALLETFTEKGQIKVRHRKANRRLCH